MVSNLQRWEDERSKGYEPQHFFDTKQLNGLGDLVIGGPLPLLKPN